MITIFVIAPLLQFSIIGSGYFLTLDEIKLNLSSVLSYIVLFFFVYLSSFNFFEKQIINCNLPTFNSKFKLFSLFLISIPIIFFYLKNGLNLDEEAINLKRSTGAKDETIINFFIGIVLPNFYGIYIIGTNKINKFRILFFVVISSLSLLSGFRSVFISNILFLLLIRYKINGMFLDKRAKLYLLYFLIFLTIVGSLRNSKNLEIISILQSSVVRVSGLELISIIDDYTYVNGFNFFYNNLVDTFNIIIPRFFYESKPLSLSEVISTKIFSGYLNQLGIFKEDYGGVAYTVIGEAIWNLGLFGIVIYAFTFGLIFAKSSYYLNSSSWIKFLLGKSIFVNVLLLIESPQLGINAVILNFLISFLIYKFFKV